MKKEVKGGGPEEKTRALEHQEYGSRRFSATPKGVTPLTEVRGLHL